MTRVTILGDSHLTRVKLRKMVIRLDSSYVYNRMTRLASQSMTRDSNKSHFYKISGFLMDKPSSFEHKEISIFCFSDDQIAGDFLFCLSSYAMLYFKDQVSELA